MRIIEINDVRKYLNSLKIKKIIGIGTTAICFLLNDGRVLKLYHNKPELIFNQDFCEHFTKISKISNDSYIGPDELIISKNNFIGYLYPYVDAKTMHNIKDIEINELIYKYEKLDFDTKKISDNKFLLGDLHDRNILIGSLFYMIDLDRGHIQDTMTNEKVYLYNMRYINKIIIYSIFNVKLNEIMKFNNSEIENLYNTCLFSKPDLLPIFLEKIENECNLNKTYVKKIRKKIKYSVERNSYYNYL